MNITRNVIHDLLPVYAAGEASPDTVALVEEFLRRHPDLANDVAMLRATPLPDPSTSLHLDREKQALDTTKRLLRRRGIFMGVGIFLGLVPFSIAHHDGRIAFFFIRDMPPLATAAVWLASLACWAGFWRIRRRLRCSGL